MWLFAGSGCNHFKKKGPTKRPNTKTFFTIYQLLMLYTMFTPMFNPPKKERAAVQRTVALKHGSLIPFAVSTSAFLAPPPLQLAHVRLEPGRDAHQLISFPPPPPPLPSPPPLPPSPPPPHTLISQMMVYMLKKAWHDDLSPLNNQFIAAAFNQKLPSLFPLCILSSPHVTRPGHTLPNASAYILQRKYYCRSAIPSKKHYGWESTNGLSKTDSRKITLVLTLSQNTHASDLCTCKPLGRKPNSFNFQPPPIWTNYARIVKLGSSFLPHVSTKIPNRSLLEPTDSFFRSAGIWSEYSAPWAAATRTCATATPCKAKPSPLLGSKRKGKWRVYLTWISKIDIILQLQWTNMSHPYKKPRNRNIIFKSILGLC